MKNLRFKLREHFEDKTNRIRIPAGTIVYGSREVENESIGNAEYSYKAITRHKPNENAGIYKNKFHNVPTGILENIDPLN